MGRSSAAASVHGQDKPWRGAVTSQISELSGRSRGSELSAYDHVPLVLGMAMGILLNVNVFIAFGLQATHNGTCVITIPFFLHFQPSSTMSTHQDRSKNTPLLHQSLTRVELLA